MLYRVMRCKALFKNELTDCGWEQGGISMSFPDVARVVPISAISASEIGQKFRLFGVLVLSEDLTSHIAQLHSLTATKTGKAADGTSRKHQGRDAGPGVLVDLSLCMDRGNTVLKETASVVMVIGTLEENTVTIDVLCALSQTH